MNATPYVSLDALDLALAALLVLINGGISAYFRLGVGKSLIIATVRMVVQLLLVGLVLKALFAMTSPFWTGVAALVMLGFAGREAVARQRRKLTGWARYGLGTAAMAASSVLITVVALTTQIAAEPWYAPRYSLPLLGMILGNTMTGVSLGLDTLTSGVWRDRALVEARLALGHTFREASRTVVSGALRTALTPTINAMAATGLVALPGMMTGQIMAGVEPVEAVKYQILVMFLIAGGTGLGVLAAILGAAKRLTDSRQRLRLDRLQQLEND